MTRWHELKVGQRFVINGDDVCVVLDVFHVPEVDWTDDDINAITMLAITPFVGPLSGLYKALRPLMVVARCQHGEEHHWRLDVPFQVDSTLAPQLLAEHHPVCGSCGELWPCANHRIDIQVACFASHLASLPSSPDPQPEGEQ